VTDVAAVLPEVARIMDDILGRTTGLRALDRKLVTYYTLGTHCVSQVRTFPLLVLKGQMGTGKSVTLRVIARFAFRPHTFSLRAMTLPTIRDGLGDANNGTAIIEEADQAWKDSELFERMLSDRYQRDSAKASLKEPSGAGKSAGFETVTFFTFGATVLHRRIPFGDPALNGRSIFIHFKADHTRSYEEFQEDARDVIDATELIKDLEFALAPVSQLKGIAGRVFDTYKLVMAVAQICKDEEFLKDIIDYLQLETVQLKEAQSVEPDGIVLRALIECLSRSGALRFHNVKVRDLGDSVWANHKVQLRPQQIAELARDLGFTTKNSHGVTVVETTPVKLVLACETCGYTDESIEALKQEILRSATRSGALREPGDE
jgi:hypothetical protein